MQSDMETLRILIHTFGCSMMLLSVFLGIHVIAEVAMVKCKTDKTWQVVLLPVVHAVSIIMAVISTIVLALSGAGMILFRFFS